MSSMTATEVAGMQADLEWALAQNASLTNSLAVLSAERDMLRSQLDKVSSERDFWMVRATEQTAVLENTAATLIAGVERQRSSMRARQEERLGVGSTKPPAFLTAEKEGSDAGSGKAAQRDLGGSGLPNPHEPPENAPAAGKSAKSPRFHRFGSGPVADPRLPPVKLADADAKHLQALTENIDDSVRG